MHKPLWYKSIVVALIALLLTSCTGVGIYSPSRGRGNNPPQSSNPQASITIGITVGEARRLALANGVTGLRALPPGIARNLARGKPLPPGIARQLVPQGMLAGLPRIPDHEWRIAGRDLILIAIGTAIVVEILENVFE